MEWLLGASLKQLFPLQTIQATNELHRVVCVDNDQNNWATTVAIFWQKYQNLQRSGLCSRSDWEVCVAVWKCFPMVKLFLFFLHFGLHLCIKDYKNITCVQPCALMANLVAWSLKLADFLVTNNNYQKNKIQKRHCRAAKCQWVDSWRRCLHVVKTEIWCIEKNSKEQQVMWKKSQPTCEDLWGKNDITNCIKQHVQT